MRRVVVGCCSVLGAVFALGMATTVVVVAKTYVGKCGRFVEGFRVSGSRWMGSRVS